MVRFSSQSALFSLLLPFAIICNLANSCNEIEKQILLCFKHSLTDPSGMLSTWSNKEDCCEWRGVQCDINDRVTNISLPCSFEDSVLGSHENKTKHCLAGEIHPSLLQLEFLNHLNLSNHNFKALPFSLGCQNFSFVKSSHESGSSSNLVSLDLSENDMLVIPDLRWLLRLSSLQYLYLDLIDLHKETQWLHILTMLPSLSKLSLRGCQLESASPSLDYANLTSLKYLDLSGNDFFSELPTWLLQSLNLSHNQFMGTIPDEIGNMKQLESLDFSHNKFSGEIPQSMSVLSFLGALNLSFNNLRGQIPLGTQIQGFTALSFIDNPELCGTPLTKNCTHDEPLTDTKLGGNDEKGSDELLEWLYIGMGTGFAISFWVVCGSLFFNRTRRHAYFRFLYDMKDQIYVKIMLLIASDFVLHT